MQGSSASSEAKWSISIAQMFSGANGIDVLAIQEAGTLPATAEPTGREFRVFGTQVVVTEHVWNIGTRLRPDLIFIYYARTDLGGNRVNLAIASRRQADEVFLRPPPTTASRPMLGIRINNDAFFSIHALANGGADACFSKTSTSKLFFDNLAADKPDIPAPKISIFIFLLLR